MAGADVSVIIVGWHGRKWLGECLRTLGDASEGRVRVVLVDNAGDNGIGELPLGRFESVVVKTPGAMGFAEANNFGLVHGGALDSEAVCFLNQDTKSGVGWLDECVKCLRGRGSVGAVSPLVRTYEGEGWDPAFAECARKNTGQAFPLEDLGAAERVGWCATPVMMAAALVMRTETLRRTGPFDPIFGSYYEDYDLCQRVRAAGYEVGICGCGTVRHYSGSATTTEEARRARMRWILRNRAILRLRERKGGRLGAAVKCLAWEMPYNLGRGVFRTASSKPPGVVLRASGDLLKLFGRLSSAERDQREWQKYLQGIGWPMSGGETERVVACASEAA